VRKGRKDTLPEVKCSVSENTGGMKYEKIL